MNTLAQVVGYGVLDAALVGAFWPGMHFHVVFAGDEAALKFHQRNAAEIQESLERKK